MSQTDNSSKKVPHKITVRNKNPGTISTGMNTEVLIDGKPLKYARFVKIEVKANGVAKVILEVLGEVDIELDAEPIIK